MAASAGVCRVRGRRAGAGDRRQYRDVHAGADDRAPSAAPREPDRLITFSIVRPGTDRQPLSLPDLADFAQSNRTLEGIASLFGWSANLTGTGDAERLTAMRVSANYFDLTGAGVLLGRAIQPDDEQRAVALVSHGMWQRRFGQRTDAVGTSIVLNGETFTVIGILRPDFVSLVRDVDLVVPYSPAADVRRGNRAQGFLRVIARLKPGTTDAQAADDLTAIGRRLRDEYPDSHGTDTAVRVAPLHDEISGKSAPMLWMLLGAVVVVLLVACANLANLFLVRATTRQRELAVRTALGASRARIVGHVLGEAAVLGVLGGAAGLLVARMLVAALIAIGPADLPRSRRSGLGGRPPALRCWRRLAPAYSSDSRRRCKLGGEIFAARSRVANVGRASAGVVCAPSWCSRRSRSRRYC